jgi:ABC-2 type transport system permease protein
VDRLINILPLVQNENMKIYRRPRTWIMLGIVVLILLLMVVFSKINEPAKRADGNEDYKQKLEQRIASNEALLAGVEGETDDNYNQYIRKNLLEAKYALEHEIDITKDTLWGTVLNSSDLISLLAIFTIVIAADIVAGEFSGGTIKLLLIRPVKRWKILASKYIATLLYAVFGLFILLVCAMLIGGVAYGLDGFSIPFLFVKDGVVHERAMIVQALVNYGYACVNLVMMVTLAFMISSAFRSSSMAIGLSIGMMFMGEIIVGLLQKYDWIKYFLFSNTNLRLYSAGNEPVVEGMTIGFSITMLILYFLAFNAVAWGLFTKRDVAA